jgi:hypothetical protein
LSVGFARTRTDDTESFDRYFAQICAAACRGEDPSHIPPPHFAGDIRESVADLKSQRALRDLLPKMLEAEIHGRKVPLPADPLNPQSSALDANAKLIQKGNREALKYFLLWILKADEKTLKDWDYRIDENFNAIASRADMRWPAVDVHFTHTPFIADCLRYLHREIDLPDSIKKRLVLESGDDLSELALQTCTARKDRSASIILAASLSRRLNPNWGFPSEAVADYYVKLGVSGDLRTLEHCAERVCLHETRKNDAPCYVREDLERAILTIRFKTLFADQ